MKFYRCNICGNITAMLSDKGTVLNCCSEPMEKLTANSKEGAFEKHIPVFCKEGGCLKIKVGEDLHPMTKEHYIEFIVVETDRGFLFRKLEPDQKPELSVCLEKDEKLLRVYAYCNIHSLYVKEAENDEEQDC